MPFSERVKVMLYSRSGNKCAFPGCQSKLVFKLEDVQKMLNIGEAAHIVAERADGPRGKHPLPLSERNDFTNGLVLCSPHHTTIDDYPESYPAEMLYDWKKNHEAIIDVASGEADAQYADIVDKWVEGSHLDIWSALSQNVLREGGQSIEDRIQQDLQKIGIWLTSRIWPGTYPKLEHAFFNFNAILNDFVRVFALHWKPIGKFLVTAKFYKNYYKRPQDIIMQKQEEYEFHTRLVEDLFLELTRSANLICDRVREQLDAKFRIVEGVLLVSSGEYPDGSWRIHRPEYSKKERDQTQPYPGLDLFMSNRSNRDFAFGTGEISNYLNRHYIDEN